MEQYYVHIHWPSDDDPALPRKPIHLVAGPYSDIASVNQVARVMQEYHRNSGTEADRDLNFMLFGRENDWTPTDQARFLLIRVSTLKHFQALGNISIDYRVYLEPYRAKRLEEI